MVGIDQIRTIVERAIAGGDGILRLDPAWVARDLLPPGRRLGLPEDAYDVGERGFITERWLASTTRADNAIGSDDEGLSYLALDADERITLKDAVDAAPVAIMGEAYAAAHAGLGRLAKIFDYAARLPLHLHQRREHAALVGRNSKDEAYYFPPGVEMGVHPETFLGLHPGLVDRGEHELLLPYLVDWNSDRILRHSVGYVQIPEEGFFVPSGVVHAPGTALTIELQEDSDVFAMLQALNAGRIISKELLWKDVRPQDRDERGERFILELIDWERNGDPDFYSHHHLEPQPIHGSERDGGREDRIFYRTPKFGGTRVIVRPGGSYRCVDAGVHSVFVWRGTGRYGAHDIVGGRPGLDELLVTHDRAITGVDVVNAGDDELHLVKFFGPDLSDDVVRADVAG